MMGAGTFHFTIRWLFAISTDTIVLSKLLTSGIRRDNYLSSFSDPWSDLTFLLACLRVVHPGKIQG